MYLSVISQEGLKVLAVLKNKSFLTMNRILINQVLLRNVFC